ncbi:thiopeptide maturation pyridine synthase [Nonomuraea polychroma]|uniref:thiopeptide maturation pyridine synthase n=1 Tax=Nonomuraea polychroma TaxID=46176 RepID=UPI003D8D7F53
MSTWHCAHVYYHADRDALLLGAVRPLLARVREQVEAAYVLRHWRQGPHVRINVRTSPDVWRVVVRPALDEIVGGYLKEHPSTTTLDAEAVLARHRLMAMREEERGTLTPWRADNSIHEEPFDSRHHVLGSDQAVDLLTSFYTDSNDLLFDMLEHAGGKLGVAMNLMLTVAHTSQPIASSYMSFRSHAEGYLTWAADPAASRTAFDRAYAAQRDALVARVRDVIRTLDEPESGPMPFVREWAALMDAYRERAGELAQPMTGPGEVPVQAPRREPSELHRLIFDSPAYHDAVFADPSFLRYRVLLNYTYLHLTRLGLTPLERFHLCHLTANAVEDAYGVSGLEQIRQYIESR